MSTPLVHSIRPTEARWRKFRQALDEINVWQWQTDYPNPGDCDGTLWSFEIAYPDQAPTTRGDNNYSDADGAATGDGKPSKIFNRMLRAIRNLTGRRFR